MFSWEIENLINKNNKVITREQLLKIINKVDNPQIKDVKPTTAFEIVTEDGYVMNVMIAND